MYQKDILARRKALAPYLRATTRDLRLKGFYLQKRAGLVLVSDNAVLLDATEIAPTFTDLDLATLADATYDVNRYGPSGTQYQQRGPNMAKLWDQWNAEPKTTPLTLTHSLEDWTDYVRVLGVADLQMPLYRVLVPEEGEKLLVSRVLLDLFAGESYTLFDARVEYDLITSTSVVRVRFRPRRDDDYTVTLGYVMPLRIDNRTPHSMPLATSATYLEDTLAWARRAHRLVALEQAAAEQQQAAEQAAEQPATA